MVYQCTIKDPGRRELTEKTRVEMKSKRGRQVEGGLLKRHSNTAARDLI